MLNLIARERLKCALNQNCFHDLLEEKGVTGKIDAGLMYIAQL